MAQHHRPRTPPSGELQFGLHHLLQHNLSTPPLRQQQQQHHFSANQAGSTYGSPALLQQTLSSQPNTPYLSYSDTNLQHPDDLGLGIQYDGFGGNSTNYYPAAPNAFSNLQVSVVA